MTGAAYYDAIAFLASADPPKRLPTAAELERALNDAALAGQVREFGVVDEVAESEGPEEGDKVEEVPERIAHTVLEIPGHFYGVQRWREWTSSIINLDSSETPMFGDDVALVGARWTQSGDLLAAPGGSSRYEWSDSSLGFRGKVDLPRSLAELGR